MGNGEGIYRKCHKCSSIKVAHAAEIEYCPPTLSLRVSFTLSYPEARAGHGGNPSKHKRKGRGTKDG